MQKTKVYELCKRLKLTESQLFFVLGKLDIEFSSRFTSLSEEDVALTTAWCEQNIHLIKTEAPARHGGSIIRRRRKKATNPPRELQQIMADIRKVGSLRDNLKAEEKIIKLEQELTSAYPDKIEKFNNLLQTSRREGILKVVRYYGTWKNFDDAKKKIEELRKEFSEKHFGNVKDFDAALNLANQARDLVDGCYKLGSGGKKSKAAKKISKRYNLDLEKVEISFLVKKQKELLVEIGFGSLCRKAEVQFKKGENAARRFKQERNRFKNGKVRTTVQPRHHRNPVPQAKTLLQNPVLQQRKAPPPAKDLHANDLRALSPRANWILLLDETGTDFSFSAQSQSDIKAQLGRMVGLLIPGVNCLPKLPTGWHAVDVEDVNEIDSVLQNVLNAECGVFGLSVKSLPPTPGERWAQLAHAVIEWVVRLLPLNGDTNIEVLIEQRGTYASKQNWQLMADVIKHSLANTLPERAKKIELQIKTIAKEGHPCNGYVDCLAFTWAQSTQWSRDRLRDSGLNGTCLLSIDANLLLHNWNTFILGGDLNGEAWGELVYNTDASSPASIVTSLLNSLGNECRENPNLWNRYLEYSMQHASSKAICLPQLAKQIDWLDRFIPEALTLPAPLRLAWLTVKLANSNHHGKAEISWLKEFEELGDRLYIEDAPMVCHADLHRAVQATNRFEFDLASEALQRWHNCEPVIPGLRYWAQTQSSLGQHAAFLGNTEEAIIYFDNALDAFKKLSYKGVAECKQTGAYKAIVMMDDKRFNEKINLATLVGIMGNLDQAIERFSLSNAAEDKYSHHLLLRYLVFRGNAELQQRYLVRHEDWKCGAGHPWPLIQGYRAILLYPQDQEKALESMIDGAALAFDTQQGPTVQFIGAGLRGIAHAWGDSWPESNEVLDELQNSLPRAQTQIKTLQNFIAQPYDERKLLAEILPFNFR